MNLSIERCRHRVSILSTSATMIRTLARQHSSHHEGVNMTDTNETNETIKEDTKPKEPKTFRARVVRAVDRYHHRNQLLTVPNDDYHRGLVRAGHLRKEG